MNWDYLATRNARVLGPLLDRNVFTVSKGLPGPVERVIEYTAPFTHQNQETDYASV